MAYIGIDGSNKGRREKCQALDGNGAEHEDDGRRAGDWVQRALEHLLLAGLINVRIQLLFIS